MLAPIICPPFPQSKRTAHFFLFTNLQLLVWRWLLVNMFDLIVMQRRDDALFLNSLSFYDHRTVPSDWDHGKVQQLQTICLGGIDIGWKVINCDATLDNQKATIICVNVKEHVCCSDVSNVPSSELCFYILTMLDSSASAQSDVRFTHCSPSAVFGQFGEVPSFN